MRNSAQIVLILLLCSASMGDEKGKLPPHAKEGRPAALGSESLAEALRCTTLGEVVARNGGKFPRSTREWVEALGRFGTVVTTYVPFSRSPNSSSLTRPRILLTVQNRWDENGRMVARPSFGTNIMDHVFVSISFNPDGTQTAEFITSRQRPPGFQFGAIQNYRNPSQARFQGHASASANCFTCHRNQSPIFPDAPWSDTDNHMATRVAMLEALNAEQPAVYGAAFRELTNIRRQAGSDEARFRALFQENRILRNQELVINGESTGLKLFGANAGGFDSKVRAASEYHFLMQAVARGDHRGRTLLRESLRGLTQAMLESSDLIQVGLGSAYNEELRQYSSADATTIAAINSSFLREFNPVTGRAHESEDGGPNPLDREEINRILSFNGLSQDERRNRHQRATTPSTAAGFTNTLSTGRGSNKNSISFADGLRFLLRLTDADLSELDRLRREVPAPVWNEVRQEVLRDRRWQALYEARQFPDRFTYLETLAAAINTALEKRRITARFRVPERPSYAERCESSSDSTPSAESTLQSMGAIPQRSGNCAGCHHEGAIGSAAFPFDPEDREAWRTWWNDPRRRPTAQRWKQKIIERLQDTTRPMPPTDSEEARAFSSSERDSLIEFLSSLR